MSIRDSNGRFDCPFWRQRSVSPSTQIYDLLNEGHGSEDLEEYHFVGECCFEGVMKGEAFNLTLSSDVEKEVFVLV